MQNQIFELSNKLNTEAQSKSDLMTSRNNYENEMYELKKHVQSIRSEKAAVSASLNALESEANELKLKLEDALRRSASICLKCEIHIAFYVKRDVCHNFLFSLC